jgi:sRNA-binding carbon storage regulator CsrA
MSCLIVSRREQERVRLRVGEVEVWIIYAGLNRSGQARLVFNAPREVEIMREELIDRKDGE